MASLVFGPDKLPDLARRPAAWCARSAGLANTARDELRDELGPEYADLELRDLDPRTIVRGTSSRRWTTTTSRPGRRAVAASARSSDGEIPPYDADAT